MTEPKQCEMCKPYGTPGWIRNAGQNCSCYRCNPGAQKIAPPVGTHNEIPPRWRYVPR